MNATFQDGRTAFMVACEKGNLNIEEREWFSNTVKCCLKIGEFMKHQVFLKMCMVWQIITILPRFLKSFFSQHFQTECVWCRLEAFCHFRLIHAYLMTSHLFNQLGLYKVLSHFPWWSKFYSTPHNIRLRSPVRILIHQILDPRISALNWV